MSKPRIVHVIPWQMTVGGAQRFIAELCDWAAPWAELHLVHRRTGSDKTWTDSLKHVTCHPVDNSLHAAKIVDMLAPDLIHHHCPGNDYGIHGLNGKYPLLGTPHGWNGNIEPKPWCFPICGPHAQIRHGIDLDFYRPGRRPQPDDHFHVGIVGRLREDKVPMTFLRELKSWLPKQRGRIVIHFLGRGLVDRAGRKIQQAAAEIPGVRLHGDITPAEMPSIYNQLDAVLIPSARDSVSLVALEAMACEIPVVVRNVEGLPDTIGDAGIVCDTDEALLAAVDQLRRNSTFSRTLAKRGRKRVEKLFDKRRMLADYQIVYARLLKRKSPGGIGISVNPDVSVVMPVANGIRPEWLYAAVKSVREQRDVKHELVIVDDGITEPELIHALGEVESPINSIRVHRLGEHRGISAALNRGLQASAANLVARFDADDIMPAGRLAAQAAFMRRHPDVTVLCGDMARLMNDGSTTPRPKRVLRDQQPLWEYWEGNWPVAHPTVMYRRLDVLGVGGYDKSVNRGQDLDLWCRLQQGGFRFHKEHAIWNHYRIHDRQQTAKHGDVRAATKAILDKYRRTTA